MESDSSDIRLVAVSVTERGFLIGIVSVLQSGAMRSWSQHQNNMRGFCP